jgi:ubiquinone/menaquinone biosynthesis C-methylase UbiE
MIERLGYDSGTRHACRLASMSERERIQTVFTRRDSEAEDRYLRWNPGNLFMHQERERALLALLRRHGMLPLDNRTILDVGCGSGSFLRDFLSYGARPENLSGVDLLESRVAAGREISPQLDLRAGDATALPYADRSFDLVLAFTLFSSIENRTLREKVANEIRRVLRPDGGIVSYDFWVNPLNRDVNPVGVKDIRRLFPGCTLDVKSVTLVPPLARALAPRAWLACELLGRLPPLRTHRLVWISTSLASTTKGHRIPR